MSGVMSSVSLLVFTFGQEPLVQEMSRFRLDEHRGGADVSHLSRFFLFQLNTFRSSLRI
jgi:hypothetical protein